MLTLNVSPEAEADLVAALNYWDERSPTYADQMAAEVDARYALLLTQPRFGRTRDDLAAGLRSTVVGKYVVLYRIGQTTLDIVRFLHGSRDILRIIRGDESD